MFAQRRMHGKVIEERFLPPSRDRQPNSVTWRAWWERKFGDALGKTLDQYLLELGSG